MRACASLLFLFVLAGCAASELFPERMSDEAAGPEPTNYRYLVADALGGIIGTRDDSKSRVLEISAPRRVDSTRGGAWLVCLKWVRYPSLTPRGYYAVFFQKGKVYESRLSVVLDQCESQPYSPFEWSVDMDNPARLQVPLPAIDQR